MKTNQLKENLENYLIDLDDLAKSKNTINNYKATIKRFINYLESNKVNDLNQRNINTIMKMYRRYLNDNKLKASTRNRYLNDTILFLAKQGLNIEIEIPKNNNNNKKIKYLTSEEIQEVINTIPLSNTIEKTKLRDKAIILTLFKTGLRVSELSNLKKQCLNLDSKEELIAIEVRAGKGEKDRTTYIDQDTLKLINEMIQQRTKEFKQNENDNDYLFTSITGTQLKERAIQKIIKNLAISTDKRLKEDNNKTIEKDYYKNKLTPHTLRHSLAIYLINEKNIPLNIVQKILGHSNIATTNIYTEIDNKETKKAMLKVWK